MVLPVRLLRFAVTQLLIAPVEDALIEAAFGKLLAPNAASLRSVAIRLGIGRETLRVAARNNFIFKTISMTQRVIDALVRINNESITDQRFTSTADLVLSGERALEGLRTPLVNGELPNEMKFTTQDPEQVFLSEGSGAFTSEFTTSQPRPVGARTILDTVRELGIDPDKIVQVHFR